ncbi:FAD-binding oxidoreductase [Candidatus Uhrbacteria bacterium]|nr:FAD-binding oxidoreductase [Candidatus Uhrbacteria bacterium]
MIKTSSPWLDATPDQRRYPGLVGDVKADVVVVGAGIVGVMTAWELEKRGVKVVLLEKNHVATGDTGFTTAFITRIPDTSISRLRELYDLDFVRRVLAATRLAQQYLKKTILDEQIDCGYKECDSYYCAYQAGDPTLQAEWSALKEVDDLVEWVSGPAVQNVNSKIAEAIKIKNEARFDVRKFIFGLLARPRLC